MAKVVVNTGLVDIEVENEKGKSLGVIVISTTDFNLIQRLETCKNNIGDIAKEIKSSDDIKEVDEKIRKELDTAFEYEVSKVVFGNQNCLNLRNGKTFAERLIESLLPVIQKEFEKELKASDKRVAKYTEQYHK